MTLLVGTTLTSVGMNTESPIEKTSYNQNMDNVNGCFDCNCNAYIINEICNRPGLNIEFEPPSSELVSYEHINIDLPSYFNWMDHEGQDWTTPCTNQWFPNPCGSCWAFGALAALEAVINIKEGIPNLNPELSVQYVLSCLSGAGSCKGGDDHTAFKYIKRNDSKGNDCNGIIPEACFPYQGIDKYGNTINEGGYTPVLCEQKCENWEYYVIPINDTGTIYPGMDSIKSTIIEKGPVTGHILDNANFSTWGATHHSPDDYFPFENVKTINHCVIIVGWKDDPSIGKGGYWICKNSYGNDFGYNGYFNIEYESLAIQYTWCTWVDYNSEDYDWHPTPKAHGPYFGLLNDPLQLTGENSGEHPPFTYHWEFGDETVSTDQNPTHIYTTEGEYPVTLTVTDDLGNSFYDTTSAWIQNGNQAPETPILYDVPEELSPGEYFLFNVTAFDPDTPIVYYLWEFGDLEKGVWSDPIFSSDERGLWGFVAPYEEGSYSIRIKLMDPYGAESEWGEAFIEVSKTKSSEYHWFTHLLQQFMEKYPLLGQLLTKGFID